MKMTLRKEITLETLRKNGDEKRIEEWKKKGIVGLAVYEGGNVSIVAKRYADGSFAFIPGRWKEGVEK